MSKEFCLTCWQRLSVSKVAQVLRFAQDDNDGEDAFAASMNESHFRYLRHHFVSTLALKIGLK